MSRPTRTALVTGGASGIGAAIARRLRDEGYRVLVLDRHSSGAGGDSLVADITVSADRDRAVAAVAQASGALDVLVNAAGVAPIAQTDDAHDARVIEVNLTAAIALTRACLPLLRAAAGAKVLNVGSIQADRAAEASVAYAASKAGLHAATRALAVDLAPEGILVNALAPGFIDTPMAVLPEGGSEYDTEWFRRVYLEHGRLPLRRPGRPEEVAAAAWALLTPENTYVTGAVLAVDGGLGATL